MKFQKQLLYEFNNRVLLKIIKKILGVTQIVFKNYVKQKDDKISAHVIFTVELGINFMN